MYASINYLILKELQAKNDAANAKLRQMVKDQQEAEKKKVQSQEIQQQLAIQTVAIDQKREDVMADLAQVEPAVIDAQNGILFIIFINPFNYHYFYFHLLPRIKFYFNYNFNYLWNRLINKLKIRVQR